MNYELPNQTGRGYCGTGSCGLGAPLPRPSPPNFTLPPPLPPTHTQGVPPSDPGWWASLLRIMVHVQPLGACIEVSFTAAPASPAPYRVDNRTPFTFSARQKGAEHASPVVVPPRSQVRSLPDPFLIPS